MSHQVGDVVYCDFPKTDMTGFQDRPCVLIAEIVGEDMIACMITKKKSNFDTCIPLSSEDMAEGSLAINPCYIRPIRLVTVNTRHIRRLCGRVTDETMSRVHAALREKFSR